MDFALGSWHTNSFDLVFLLFTSTDRSIDERQRDELLQYYHGVLVSALKRLNYPQKVPTLSDIHISLFKPGFYYVLFTVFAVVLRFLNETRGDGFLCWTTTDAEDEKYRNKMFANPECEEHLKYLMDYYYRKGYLDI